jgi:hypothetical protein
VARTFLPSPIDFCYSKPHFGFILLGLLNHSSPHGPSCACLEQGVGDGKICGPLGLVLILISLVLLSTWTSLKYNTILRLVVSLAFPDQQKQDWATAAMGKGRSAARPMMPTNSKHVFPPQTLQDIARMNTNAVVNHL